MKFRTKISQTKDGKHLIRGHELVELIKNHSFSEMIFLLVRGDLPKENEKQLLESILVAAVENGISPPSIFIPRIVASTGNSFNTALASGVLAIGEKHGGAVEKAAQVFGSGKSAEDIVRDFQERKKFIPGFGHKVFKREDPRARAIFEKAKALELSSPYFELAYNIERKIEENKGKKIPLNIDGAMAAGMLQLGFNWKSGKAFFIISRLVGMTAHVLEEFEQGNRYYRLEKEDIE
ncbi:MAG: citryl-CoA lyase [Patescibacteria group bacterium]|nr:citryl-CoA lyase [Patescibacteria group bacterium]